MQRKLKGRFSFQVSQGQAQQSWIVMETAESFIAVVAQQGPDLFCDVVVIDAQARFAYWTLQTNGAQTVLCGEHSFILFDRDVVKTLNILMHRHPFISETIISLVLFSCAVSASRDAPVMKCVDLDSTRRRQWSELDKRKNFPTIIAALLDPIIWSMSLTMIVPRQKRRRLTFYRQSLCSIGDFSWSSTTALAITRRDKRELNVRSAADHNPGKYITKIEGRVRKS
jgi:hypothetical protein